MSFDTPGRCQKARPGTGRRYRAAVPGGYKPGASYPPATALINADGGAYFCGDVLGSAPKSAVTEYDLAEEQDVQEVYVKDLALYKSGHALLASDERKRVWSVDLATHTVTPVIAPAARHRGSADARDACPPTSGQSPDIRRIRSFSSSRESSISRITARRSTAPRLCS